MLSSEQLKWLSADQLAWTLCLEIPFHNINRWIGIIRLARESDSKKLDVALGLISMDDCEECVIWALNTSCLNRNFLWRVREDGKTRKVRELAERILFGERYPEFWI